MGLNADERRKMRGFQTRLDEKIHLAKQTISRTMAHYKNPAVLWSGGKDSMVLLHLLLTTTLRSLPVICWREPWMPWKQAFVNRMIAEWSLTVWDWHPQAVTLCKGHGRIDVLNHYQMQRGTMILARGTEPPEEGKAWMCGRDTFLARPLGGFAAPWDVAFHGHKSTDDDPTSGKIPLAVDILDTPGTVAYSYPLREWTDEDIFAYIEAKNLPYDEARYERTDEGWRILPDKFANPDYYATCLRCMDPDAGPFVHCPKLNSQINNVSASVVWQQPRLAYCGLRTEGEDGK